VLIPRTPRTRAKRQKEPFPYEIWPGVAEHRKHMLPKCQDLMSRGNRRSKPSALLNQQVYDNTRQTHDLHRELHKPGTAYTLAPLIQQIPHLILYRKGDPADAHEIISTFVTWDFTVLYTISRSGTKPPPPSAVGTRGKLH